MIREEIYTLIEAERNRQIAKGYDVKYDDKEVNDGLAFYSAFYIVPKHFIEEELYYNANSIPKSANKDKHTRKEQLIIGIALAVAELERLERGG